MKKIVKTQLQYDKLIEQRYSGEVYLLINISDVFLGINISIGKSPKLMTNECLIYMKDGVIHREKDPAIIYKSLWFTNSWYIENGNYVNDDNRPSFIRKSKSDTDIEITHCYYNENHDLHCEFAPAYIQILEEKFKTSIFKKYFLEGREMTKENFYILKDKFVLKRKVSNL